jgi:hypothetical protein
MFDAQRGSAEKWALVGGGIGATIGFVGGFFIVGPMPGHLIEALASLPFTVILATVGFGIGLMAAKLSNHG